MGSKKEAWINTVVENEQFFNVLKQYFHLSKQMMNE